MSTKQKLVTRNVTIIDLSDPHRAVLPQVYQPQSSLIYFKNRTIDIGAHAHRKLNIKRVKNSNGEMVCPVAPDSIDLNRLPFLKKVIEYATHICKSKSQYTVCTEINYTLLFLNFYFQQDDLEFADVMNQMYYEEAAQRYSAMLNSNNNISGAVKYKYTKMVFSFAEFIFDEIELNQFNFYIIPNLEQGGRSTKPLLPEELYKALALRLAIFSGVHELLIGNQQLPFALKLPSFLGEPKNRIWLGYSPFGGPKYLPRAIDLNKVTSTHWFDTERGVRYTKEQFQALENKTARHSSWHNIETRLHQANTDHSNQKQLYAQYAMVCFFDIFLSATAMNQQPALDLPWFGWFFNEKENQGKMAITLLTDKDEAFLGEKSTTESAIYLQSIKNRKTYRPVEFILTSRFFPLFKQYLKLREYYLQSETDHRLFPLSLSKIPNSRNYLQKTFPETPKLGSHVTRATAADHFLSSTNRLDVTAQLLQNTPKTVIRHYAQGTQKDHIEGMGGFLNLLGNQIQVTREQETDNQVETSVGNCKNGGINPDPLPNAPIESNCSQQEGCFFCRHYMVHADELDIRKLLSVLFVINTLSTRSQNIEFFDKNFRLVIERIRNLLNQIKNLSKTKHELVTRIQDEVNHQELLDEYWLNKLIHLETLSGGYLNAF